MSTKITMKFTGLTFHEMVLDHYLNSPGGKVGEHLAKKGQMILIRSKMQVGRRTLALRASIHMRHSRDPRGQYIQIGSSLPYARMHHEGTRPHKIYPVRRKMLRFVSKGQVIYAYEVNHPVTKANKYLTDPMRSVISKTT
jgi:hypothetical protein